MSLRLGPVHHWIYQQVGLVESRAERIAQGLTDQWGDEASAAWEEIRRRWPRTFSGQTLEELVEGDIHGSLDGMIAEVQSRETALLGWTLEKAGDEGRELFGRLYDEDGKSWGAKARSLIPQADPERIFAALREFWLEGMPCDVRLEVAEKSDKHLEWIRAGFPLSRYWEGSEVAAGEIFKLHCRWMSAFVAAFGKEFELKVQSAPDTGEGEYRFAIARR